MRRVSTNMGRGAGLVASVALVLAAIGVPALAAPPDALAPYAFLIGAWTASGEGQPGAGSGSTVFARSLQDRVITRQNVAEYPATGGKPASRHDDFMVIYATESGAVRADYYDNEGHVIRYAVSAAAPGTAEFLSDRVEGQPRFRLAYTLGKDGLLAGTFSIAPPGQGDAFKQYLAWSAKRGGR